VVPGGAHQNFLLLAASAPPTPANPAGGAFNAPTQVSTLAPTQTDNPPDDVIVSNVKGKTALLAVGFQSVLTVLVERPDGSFALDTGLLTDGPGIRPSALAVGDFNGDGLPDVVTANSGSANVSVLLGFSATSPSVGRIVTVGFFLFTVSTLENFDVRQTPIRADLDGDGTPDLAVLDGSGNLLFRKGLPGTDNLYAPPVVLNKGGPALADLVVARTAHGFELVGSERAFHALDVFGRPIYALDVFAWNGSGFGVSRLPLTGFVTRRLAAADLSPDRLDSNNQPFVHDDLVVSNLLNGVDILFQQPDGSFAVQAQTNVGGIDPSDISFADNGNPSGPDILVSDRFSGDVTVLYNDRTHAFSRTATFRAGTGPVYGGGASFSQSLAQPVSLVATPFTTGGKPGVVVVDRGTHNLFALNSTSDGLTDPTAALSAPTSQGTTVADQPGQAVAADFDHDGKTDLAVLMQDLGQVWIYKGDGAGHFTFTSALPAGEAPTGLALTDVNHDGNADLMVGNEFGDVLFLIGNGDGTFRPFVNADAAVPFVIDASQQNGVVLANQALSQIVAAQRVAGATGAAAFTAPTFQVQGGQIIGPGAVLLANLGNPNGTDLVVANTGSNDVLIYRRLAGGSFDPTPLTFFAGTSPDALAVADVNNDRLPDLIVANQGSNDVSVLFNTGLPGQQMFRVGPRLATGGAGPNAVSVQFVNGVPNILATNGQDGTLATIPGIGTNAGTGSFAAPQTVTIAPGPVVQTLLLPAPLALPGGGFALGLAVTASGQLVGFDEAGGTQTLLAPPPGHGVEAVQTLALPGGGTGLVTANQDDTVSLLVEGATGFTAALTLADPLPGVPSALELLDDHNGEFDIYLTNQGDSTPVVLTLDLRTELIPSPGPGGVPGAGLGLGQGVPLPLVVVLVTEVVAPTAPPLPLDSPAEAFNPFTVAVVEVTAGPEAGDASLGELLLIAIVAPGGGDEPPPPDDGGGAAGLPTLDQFLSGLMEALERLRLGDDRPDAGGGAAAADGGPAEALERWLRGWFDGLVGPAPGAVEGAPAQAAPRRPAPPPEEAPPDDAAVRAEAPALCDLVFALPPQRDEGPFAEDGSRREALSGLLAAAFVAAGAALGVTDFDRDAAPEDRGGGRGPRRLGRADL
jgi:hypothetical protein